MCVCTCISGRQVCVCAHVSVVGRCVCVCTCISGRQVCMCAHVSVVGRCVCVHMYQW